jgi:glucose/arabinose dehydrogenase
MRRWFPVVAVLAALLPAMGSSATVVPGGSFIDDDGNLHEAAIEAIRAAGVTQGCSPVGDLYCPGAPVSRAEMAVFLVRALGVTSALPPYQGRFPDVAAGQWYTAFVEKLAELGITVGYPDGTFRPAAPVSRQEMAVFLVRALDEEANLPAYQGTFADVAPGPLSGYVERLAQLGITSGCATSPLRFCPFDQVLRDQMASFLARAFGLVVEAVPARPSVQGLALRLQRVASGLDRPVLVTAPAGDPRLFVVEQTGRIRIVAGGGVVATPFLDLTAEVKSGGEQGLLGLAFHPSYPTDPRFYVHYTDTAGDTRVVEYRVSADPDRADTASARRLLFADQPASNHNGGMIAFGPDGRLYVGLGDGGGANDQYGNAQNPASLLGKLVRIDLAGSTPEVFASGLRNPWRFAFDGPRLYIGDVGQGAWEEIDVVSVYDAGANLGWPVMEGLHCRTSGCAPSAFTLPVLEYGHGEGCSVTGGVVYRGAAIPELAGHYLYGDFCSGWVRSFRYTGGVTDARQWDALATPRLSSFGVDGLGEAYTVSLDGAVYRIVKG